MTDSEPALEAVKDEIELGQIVIGYLDAAITTLNINKVDQMLEDWAMGHLQFEPTEEQVEAMAMLATDACLFAPSLSGATPMSRFIASVRTDDPLSRQALKLMSRSEIRFVQIMRRLDPDLVELEDWVSGERLVLLDSEFSEGSERLNGLFRLCRFDSGRYFLLNYPFLVTETLREIVENYIRPGKGISNPYRCACAVYKHAAREGIVDIPFREYTKEEQAGIDAAKLEAAAADLDAEWSRAKNDPELFRELVDELRDVASAESVISYLLLYNMALKELVPVPPENLRQICALVIAEFIERRSLFADDPDDEVENLQQIISGLVRDDELHEGCKTVFDEVLRNAEL